MTWSDKITGKALEIALCDDSPLRIIAGPGTGKTFSLKARLARLLEEGANPKEILLITYTRVAADDLIKEVNKLEIPNAKAIDKGTLHALCFRILNRIGESRGINNPLHICLGFEVRFLLQDLMLFEVGGYYFCEKQLKAVEAGWARNWDDTPGSPTTTQDYSFKEAVEQWLNYHEALLLNQFAPKTLEYLRDNPLCQERNKYKHVLVDEYQDLNRAEQVVIDLLSENGTLTVVGDEDQSIYEDFRYAHPEGISEFNTTHPNTHDIPLVVCRRCPKRIVKLANALIDHNIRRAKHNIVENPDNCDGDVSIVQWSSIDEEVDKLTEYIHNSIQCGTFNPGEILVLTPIKNEGRLIRDKLNCLGHIAHTFFNEEILEGNPKTLIKSQAQQAFSLLNLLAFPDDSVALRCWLGYGAKDLNSKEYQVISSESKITGIPIRNLLDSMLSSQQYKKTTNGILSRYQELLLQESILSHLRTKELVDHVFPSDKDWSEPFRRITQFIDDTSTVVDLFDLLRSNIIQPELPIDVDYIRIMSLYKSKGLNAEHVIILGCLEGLVPRKKEKGTIEEKFRYQEEQRRLFYVAISRPKKTLVISSFKYMPVKLAYKMRASIIHSNAQIAEVRTSTFIEELGKTCPRPIKGSDWTY
ncbi:MAG: UvrD-helicase domain-containing protein [Anaerolineae bacterium]